MQRARRATRLSPGIELFGRIGSTCMHSRICDLQGGLENEVCQKTGGYVDYRWTGRKPRQVPSFASAGENGVRLLRAQAAKSGNDHLSHHAALVTVHSGDFWLKGTALKGFCLEVFDHRRVDLLRCLCKSEVCTVWRGHQIAYPAIVLNQLLSLAREVSIK